MASIIHPYMMPVLMPMRERTTETRERPSDHDLPDRDLSLVDRLIPSFRCDDLRWTVGHLSIDDLVDVVICLSIRSTIDSILLRCDDLRWTVGHLSIDDLIDVVIHACRSDRRLDRCVGSH